MRLDGPAPWVSLARRQSTRSMLVAARSAYICNDVCKLPICVGEWTGLEICRKGESEQPAACDPQILGTSRSGNGQPQSAASAQRRAFERPSRP